MSQHQSSITSFLNTPSPDISSYKGSTQPLSKKIKHKRKRTSWIWAHFIKKLTDNNESVIICQVLKEDLTKCNVKLVYDESTMLDSTPVVSQSHDFTLEDIVNFT